MSVQINGTTGVTTPAIVFTGSTSGTLTVVGPAVAGSTTITFPATSGTALLQAPSGALSLTNGSGGVLVLQPAAGAGTTTITFPATAGSSGQFLSTDGAGNTTWTAPGAAAAAGANTQVQYNNAGILGAAAGFTFNGTAQITLGAASASSGAIRLFSSAGANPVTIDSGNNSAAWTLTLPTGAGTNGQVLTTNGSGVTSWGSPAAGSAAGGTFDVGTASGVTGSLNLYNSGAAGGVTLKSGVNTAAWTLTLPIDDGTNGQVLTTDGAGVTSWQTPAAGSATNGVFNVGTGSGTTGSLNLFNAGAPGAVTIKSAVNIAPWTLTLPVDDGTNGQVLTTDGSGITYWNTPSAGSATGGNFDIGTAGTQTGSLNLYNAGSPSGVTIQSSSTNSANWNLTLPDGPGTNGYFLTTNGSGATSWSLGNITIGTTAINLGATATTLGGLTTVTVTQDPVNPLQLATKQYVDANVDPLNRISPCKYATATNTPPTGNATIDGSAVATSDRVLLINNTTASENGVWEVNTGGAWARPLDAASWGDIVAATVFVTSGATLANTSWIQLTPAPGTMNVTAQNWVQQSGLNSYTGGLGITISGTNVVDNAGVVVLDTGTTGLSNTFTALTGTAQLGGTLAVTHGGTGQTTAAAALTALLPAQGPNSGKTLTTDGTTATWQTPSAGSAAGGTFTIGTATSTTGTLSLYSSASAFGVNIRSSANTAAWNLVLPQNGGTSGQVLQTDGTGATVWTTLVNSGTSGQLAWYSATGSTVSGNANVTASAGALTLGVAGTAAGSLKLSGSTSGTVTVNTAAAAGGWTLTLPATAGASGEFLSTNGSGVTSWSAITLDAGTTAITGTTGSLLYNNAGVVDEIVMGTGVAAALAANTGAANGFVTLDGSGNLPAATSGTFGTAGPAGTTGTIDLYNATNANALTLQPGATSPAWTLTLPTGPGTNGQVLQTNGSGVTSWVTPATGLTIGTTGISGGTDGKILFNNSNVVGEKSVEGTGNVVLKSGPEITSLRETKTNGTISGGALAIDCSLGNVLAISLNANITSITFSNIPASGSAYSVILSFTADGTARTITWPAAVRWPGGTAPTMTSTNNKVDTIVLYTYDGGTNWFGFVSGQNA